MLVVPAAPSPTRLLVVQLSDASCGLLLPWARGRGWEVEHVRPDLGEPLPALAGMDGLAVLGADTPADDRRWMPAVRHRVAEALATDVPVLGIALGAQVMASILGAEIVPDAHPFCGWTSLAGGDPEIPGGPWLAHGAGTVLLPETLRPAALDARGVQAFRTGPHLGLIFHAHATPATVRAWERGARLPVPPELVAQATRQAPVTAHNARRLLTAWAAGAGLERHPAPLRAASPRSA